MTKRRLKHATGLAGLAGVAGILAPCALPCHAEPLPPSVAAVIDAAAATGKPETLKTVADLIKKTNPASVAEIDAQIAALKAKAEKARLEKLAKQGFFEGIKGEGQVGFSNSTGQTKTVSLALGLKVSNESLHWKNTLTLKADYERENKVTSEERYFAGYEGRYKFTPRQFALTTVSWERDPFAGFSARVAGSIGLGYMLIDRPNLSLSLDAGPGSAPHRLCRRSRPGGLYGQRGSRAPRRDVLLDHRAQDRAHRIPHRFRRKRRQEPELDLRGHHQAGRVAVGTRLLPGGL